MLLNCSLVYFFFGCLIFIWSLEDLGVKEGFKGRGVENGFGYYIFGY